MASVTGCAWTASGEHFYANRGHLGASLGMDPDDVDICLSESGFEMRVCEPGEVLSELPGVEEPGMCMRSCRAEVRSGPHQA
jgi:hypothetical protein